MTKFAGQEIRFLEFAPNGLLLNTADVCSILGITDRQPGTDLGQSCLDIASATYLAIGRNQDFAEWLNETFADYPLRTLIRPDDAWSKFPTQRFEDRESSEDQES